MEATLVQCDTCKWIGVRKGEEYSILMDGCTDCSNKVFKIATILTPNS